MYCRSCAGTKVVEVPSDERRLWDLSRNIEGEDEGVVGPKLQPLTMRRVVKVDF